MANDTSKAKNKYFIFEELRNANPMVLCRFVDLSFINSFFKEIGLKSHISEAIIKYENEKVAIYFNPNEFDSVAKPIVDIFTSDTDEGFKLNESIIKSSKALISRNREFHSKLESKELSLEELIDMWKQMERQYADLFKFTWIHNALDFKDNLFTTFLFELLNNLIDEKQLDINPNETFVTLTTPDSENSYFAKLEVELSALKKDLQKHSLFSFKEVGNFPEIQKRLTDIADDYCWLGFGFDGPAWNEEHFFESARNATTSSDADEDLTRGRNLLESKMELSTEQGKLFELSREVVEGTGFRKEAMFNYFYTLDLLFDQLSTHLNIPKQHLRYVYPDEIKHIENCKDELVKRIEHHIDHETFENRNIYLGKDAKEFFTSLDIVRKDKFNGEYIKGQTSYPGCVLGTAKIVNQKEDVEKVEKGDVMISIATNPELVTAMKLASAFVTDRGGITCHAAIMSRELKIPCVIGTKIATEIIKDGDTVEVDATNGIVRKLH